MILMSEFILNSTLKNWFTRWNCILFIY